MTGKQNFKRSKLGVLISLILICVLCFAAALFTACGTSSDVPTDSTYTKVEDDDALIKNGSFEFGSADYDEKSYPQTSPTGWTSSSANAYSSTVDSGIVSTSDAEWAYLMDNLYDDSDFLDYVKNKKWVTAEEMTQKTDDLKEEFPSLSDDEIQKKLKAWVIDEKITPNFANPKTHDGADGKVYMLNNYLSTTKFGLGTAQTVTSSEFITIEKNKVGHFSFWVKTVNINATAEKFGANVRFINTLSGTTQNECGIYGINTAGATENNGWVKYDIYVQADEFFASALKIVFGLGFANGSSLNNKDYVEGTVYFDDIVYEEIDEIPAGKTSAATTEIVSFTKTAGDGVYKDASTFAAGLCYLYDMRMSSYFATVDTTYVKNLTFDGASPIATVTGNLTVSNGKTSADYFAESSVGSTTKSGNSFTVNDIASASYTVKISSAEFKVAPESYVYVSFDVLNSFDDEFIQSGISVYIYDKKAGYKTNVTSVYDFVKIGETERCAILVKNDYPASIEDVEREFDIIIVLGPTEFSGKTVKSEFASGSAAFSGFSVRKGLSYQYVKDVAGDPTEEETPHYSYYSLYSSTANKTISLFAGRTENYSEDGTATYNLTPSLTDKGAICFAPANVTSYVGVTPNHIYITGEDEGSTSALNSKKGISGLINSKYSANYDAAVVTALNHDAADDDVQVIVINNNDESYGFIGTEKITVSASSYAKISVKVRVTGDAVAYIYLVDISEEKQQILQLDDFIVNTDGENYTTTGLSITDNLFAIKVTADMMSTAEKGWLTVKFFVGTGKNDKTLRLEMWNGSRDGEETSTGIVFFDLPDSAITSSDAFTEDTDWSEMFTSSESALYKEGQVIEKALYKRILDKVEEEYNSKQTDSDNLVSYDAKYAWIKGTNYVYGIYNALPGHTVAVNPNTDEGDSGSGCAAESDPSTFWLSLSSILLTVALVFAIIMLIIKNVVRRKKARKSDATSHFDVKSRYRYEKKKPVNNTDTTAEETAEETDTAETETVETPESQDEAKDDTVIEIDTPENDEPVEEYVYGDVQDFGEGNEEKKEEPVEEKPENTDADATEENK